MANGKRGVALLVGSLVGVVALGSFGYGLLSSRASIANEDAVYARKGGATEAADDRMMLVDHDATVYDESGEVATTLTSVADGRPLVINFWATWCPYCVQELPDFQRVYAEYSDRVSFAFVNVADGNREKASAAAAWLVEQGYGELPAYYDIDLSASSAFGAWSLPTTAVVSADGEIMTISPGTIDAALLRDALSTLVERSRNAQVSYASSRDVRHSTLRRASPNPSRTNWPTRSNEECAVGHTGPSADALPV